jgi:glycosyltransferase involved in cell wall biosynthesis
MLETFKAMGYTVRSITGTRAERKRLYADVKNDIENGEQFDYVYVESLSRPSNSRIDEKFAIKRMVRENLDFDFIEYCVNKGLKTGYFIRDLYWDFKDHFTDEPLIKGLYLRLALKKFGKKELKFLRTRNIQVFCPTPLFADHLKSNWNVNAQPLPPGSDIVNSEKRSLDSAPLEVFYVGGVAGLYNPKVFLDGIIQSENVHLTLCTRESEKAKVLEYQNEGKVSLVSGSGKELQKFYKKAHVAVHPIPPFSYARLAHGVKFSEYIANGLPIIAFEGTHMAQFIEEHQIGWTIPYESTAVPELIDKILLNPEQYREYQENVIRVQENFTWEKVVERLEKKLLKK